MLRISKYISGVLLALCALPAFAQFTSGPTSFTARDCVLLQEDGVTEGCSRRFNFTGSANLSISGGIATIDIAGGGGGSGDVVGPASATDNAIARYDGATGKLIQNSAATIADTSGNITAGTYNGNTIGAGSTSGTNTGDQASIVGITGTKAQFDTAVTDGNILYVGDSTAPNGSAGGELAGSYPNPTLTNSAVIGKVLTGYTSGAGTVAATDTILQAIQKLNGNDATNANLTGAVTSVGNATSLGSFNTAAFNTALSDNDVATLAGSEVLTDKTINGDNNTVTNVAGYTIELNGAQTNWADATTYYFGSTPQSSGTAADVNRVYMPHACTITSAYAVFQQSSAGVGTETSTAAIRLNNSTDTNISTSLLNNAALTKVENTGLSIGIAAGDYIEGKITTATWATNPTQVKPWITLFCKF